MQFQHLQGRPAERRERIRFALNAKWHRQHQTPSELAMIDILHRFCPDFRFRRDYEAGPYSLSPKTESSSSLELNGLDETAKFLQIMAPKKCKSGFLRLN